MKMLKISLVMLAMILGFEVKSASSSHNWSESLYAIKEESPTEGSPAAVVTTKVVTGPQQKAMDLFGSYHAKTRPSFGSNITKQVMAITDEVKKSFEDIVPKDVTPRQKQYMDQLIARFNASVLAIGTLLVAGEAEKTFHKRTVDNRDKIQKAVQTLEINKAEIDGVIRTLTERKEDKVVTMRKKMAEKQAREAQQRLDQEQAEERQNMQELFTRFTLAMRKNPSELEPVHSSWAIKLSQSPYVSDVAKRRVSEHIAEIHSRAKEVERRRRSDITSNDRGESTYVFTLPRNSKIKGVQPRYVNVPAHEEIRSPFGL